MSALWYWSARTLRAKIRGFLAVAALIALLGGLTLASLASARRTASAYSRFREAGGAFDVRVSSLEPHAETAHRVPGVIATATYMVVLAYRQLPGGGQDLSFDLEAVVSVDGEYFTHDRFAVTRGRLPDPGRHDEVAVNQHLARLYDVALGQRLEMGVYDPADEYAVRGGTSLSPAERVTVTIVGIGLFPEEVVEDETNRLPRMLFTPAAADRFQGLASYAWNGVELRDGTGGVDRFKRDYNALLPPDHAASFQETSVAVAHTQKAVRPLAVALGVFGLLAAVATLLLGGQALARLIRADGDDLLTLRAMGAGPGVTSSVGIVGAAAGILTGIVGAAVVAVALSPLTPIGPLRGIEVDPGLSVDWTVLAVGGAGLLLALGAVAAAVALWQAPHHLKGRTGPRPSRPSRLVRAVSTAGLPAPAVAGMRLALESGDGRTTVPPRAALTGAVVAVSAVVASLVFGTSLQALVDQPREYGWDWDLTVVDGKGYGMIDPARAHELLDHHPAVAAWSSAFFQLVDVEGRIVPFVGVEPNADVGPPLTSGRKVRSRGEVVLGATTLTELGKSVGDTVRVGSGDGAQHLRIVGSAVLPTVGPTQTTYTSLGEGGLLVYDQVPGWDAITPAPKALFIRLAPDVDRDAATEQIGGLTSQLGLAPAREGYPGSTEVLPVQRPAEIVNYSTMGAAPTTLAGLLVLAALVSLGLSLSWAVHRRRRDLSVLKALGFTRRQVSAVVVWQSSIIVLVGLVAGIPLGIAMGRWLWILFARRLPVVPRSAVPVLLLAAVAAGLLVLANVAAAVPARRAGRTPVSGILRSE